ncbi:uncharacterized protein [Palaemon carinicauda]|uniref:uncharacterized protein isoform X2 n=1 Tax=Palaemon carinicauda TaxID=392227 RepID=UPI0035B67371
MTQRIFRTLEIFPLTAAPLHRIIELTITVCARLVAVALRPSEGIRLRNQIGYTFVLFLKMYLWLLMAQGAVLISAAVSSHLDNSIKTTSNWNLTCFNLPEREYVFLAAKTDIVELSFLLHFFVDGNLAFNVSYRHNFTETRWLHIHISKTMVDTPSYQDSYLPEEFQKLEGRSIIVTSRSSIDWLMFTLPLQNTDISRTSGGTSVSFNLPEKETVIISYKLDHFINSKFELLLLINKEKIGHYTFDAKPLEWNIINVYINKIESHYKVVKFPNPEKLRPLQGRQIHLSSEGSIQWQMFSFPFENEPQGNATSGQGQEVEKFSELFTDPQGNATSGQGQEVEKFSELFTDPQGNATTGQGQEVEKYSELFTDPKGNATAGQGQEVKKLSELFIDHQGCAISGQGQEVKNFLVFNALTIAISCLYVFSFIAAVFYVRYLKKSIRANRADAQPHQQITASELIRHENIKDEEEHIYEEAGDLQKVYLTRHQAGLSHERRNTDESGYMIPNPCN